MLLAWTNRQWDLFWHGFVKGVLVPVNAVLQHFDHDVVIRNHIYVQPYEMGFIMGCFVFLAALAWLATRWGVFGLMLAIALVIVLLALAFSTGWPLILLVFVPFAGRTVARS